MECLFAFLKEQLFTGSTPFARRIVVVPGPAVKRWLIQQIAVNSDPHICMGIEWHYFHDGIATICQDLIDGGPELFRIPTQRELLFRIESRLRKKGVEKRKIFPLAERLTRGLHQYGIYGGEFPEKWKEVLEGNGATPFEQLVRKGISSKTTREVQVHFFAHSFIPPIYWRFLMTQLSPCIYATSPCEGFWSDLLSDKQIAAEELWEQVYDRHPLLANWGKVGRLMAKQMEESDLISHEAYIKPEAQTVLCTLQRDLLYSKGEEIHLSENDHSLELHVGASKLREVEILHDRILFHSKLKPSEILILSPDIQKYIPYLQAVFGKDNIQIMEEVSKGEEASRRILKHFLELAKSGWEAPKVFELLHFREIRTSVGISEEDLPQIRAWIEEGGIRWGLNEQHRDEVLKRRHCFRGMMEKSLQGTWKGGKEKLFDRLIQLEEEEQSISITLALLLGRFFHWIEELSKDLAIFTTVEEKNVSEWVEHLEKVVARYCLDELRIDFQELLNASQVVSEEKFPWESIFHHLEAIWKEPLSQPQGRALGVVQAASILPMRSIPSRMIAILGLSDDAFPRRVAKDSLFKTSSSCPNATEFDRSLFLDTILAAREYLFLSYSVEGKEGTEAIPSLLVTELFETIDQTEALRFVHPFSPYDAAYFQKETQIPSFSSKNYQMASLFNTQEEKDFHSFVSARLKEPIALNDDEKISVSDLILAAKAPMKLYMQRTLGMYLPFEGDLVLEEDEPFSLSPLSQFRMKESLVAGTEQSTLETLHKGGHVPLGHMKKYFLSRLDATAASYQQQLENWQIDPQELFSAPFSSLNIVGEIGPLCKKGWLLPGKEKGVDLFTKIPHALLLANLTKNLFEGTPELLFFESGKRIRIELEDPLDALKKFVLYYQYCLANPSPLNTYYTKKRQINPYSSYVGEIPETLEEWKELGNSLFGEVYELFL